jgi:hypothetical protein
VELLRSKGLTREVTISVDPRNVSRQNIRSSNYVAASSFATESAAHLSEVGASSHALLTRSGTDLAFRAG